MVTKSKKIEQRLEPKEAQGMTATSMHWNVKPSKVTAENVPKFQSNIHYQDAVTNLVRQIYPAPPEVWVTDVNGETDEKLTLQTKGDFETIHAYDIMQYIIPDVYGYGCSVISPGISKIGNDFRLTELRHLPPESFGRMPPDGYNCVVPNPLVPGICINTNGETEVWQTNFRNGLQTKIDNFRIIRSAGTPTPSGSAYMYPVYFLLSLIDFAVQAETQQVNRIGAPMLIMKISDEADESAAEALQGWGSQFLRKWGKDTAAIVPQGLEFPTYSITESTTAKDFCAQCVEWIRTYTNPMSDMTQTGNLGASDSGRMEIWCNFISAEQDLAEHWLEELFDYCLQANGYKGYNTHIQLHRPSIDKSAIKLQYLQAAAQDKAITIKEYRDNITDVLDVQEWTPELEIELKEMQARAAAPSLFSNTVDGFTRKEEMIMKRSDDRITAVNDATYNAIMRIMHYGE